MYHSFFTHSSADMYLGCLQILAIVNSNRGAYIFFLVFWDQWGIFLQVESPGQKRVPFLTFELDFILFSTVAGSICISTNSALVFPVLYMITNTCFWFIGGSHFKIYKEGPVLPNSAYGMLVLLCFFLSF